MTLVTVKRGLGPFMGWVWS